MVQIRIAILSLNQRGFWLANELAHMNAKTNSNFQFDVSLFNLNFKRKSIVYDEIEGPFGGFLTENLEQGFIDLFQHEEPFQIQSQGLTLWNERGPLEARSPFFEKRKEIMNPYGFRLFEQFAATTSENQVKLADISRAAKYRFFTRSYSINSAERIRLKLIEEKIKVYEKTDMVDIQIPTGFKTGQTQIEFSGEIRGVENFDFVIWCMTSEEIKHFYPKIYEKLSGTWPRKTMNVLDNRDEHILYYWVPFTFKCDKTPELSALPDHFILARDTEMLVNSENLFVVKKSVLEGFYQIWSMIPSSQLMRIEYFEQKARLIEELMAEKNKKLNFQLHALPKRNESYDPGVFPVYKDLSAFSYEIRGNYYHSAEHWNSYLANDQFENMKNIRDHIQQQVMKKFKEKKIVSNNTMEIQT